MKSYGQLMENLVRSGYLAYKLSANSRNDVLHHFKPKYPDVICEHVTYQFPAKSSDPLPPAVHEAHVVGYEDDGEGLEAVVVEINGKLKRPDGKLYHITLSLDRKKGKKPVHSNALVNKSYKPVPRLAVHLEPVFLT